MIKFGLICIVKMAAKMAKVGYEQHMFVPGVKSFQIL